MSTCVRVLISCIGVSISTVVAAGEWQPFALQGTSIFTVAVHPEHRGLILAGEGPDETDGVWRSTDGGESWILISDGVDDIKRVNCIVFVPELPDLGAPESVLMGGFNLVGPALYRSTDGGASWTPITLGLHAGAAEITAIAVHPGDPHVLYAGLNDHSGGVVKSSDGGLSWREIGPNIDDGYCHAGCILDVAVHPTRPNTVFVSLPALYDVYKSTDSGASWSPVDCGQQPEELLIHARVPDTLYITGSVPSRGGISKSTDAGESWTFLAHQPGLPIRDDASHRAIISHPARPELLFLVVEHFEDFTTVEAVYRSDDGGQSWVMDDAGLEGVRVVGFTYRGGRLLAATDDGIYQYSQILPLATPEESIPRERD